ncbi:hypothetical protein Cgig2_019902 [Carnegiea gigantea]|uniref:Uncharacterized protein n=1 Tax=Carnegiea gigantea TaxID=171969 RepID=A0A9Q1QJP6_9CARY|nr:hypothetical protein Cgig2_019902 [Carnegiea gigantea]
MDFGSMGALLSCVCLLEGTGCVSSSLAFFLWLFFVLLPMGARLKVDGKLFEFVCGQRKGLPLLRRGSASGKVNGLGEGGGSEVSTVGLRSLILLNSLPLCQSRLFQRWQSSSPHNLVRNFVLCSQRKKNRKDEEVLEKECRPLVAFPGALNSPEKQSSLPGHLVIDKLKHQMQRESREAVSTSHSSQSNTLEYELALEWRLQQDRSDLCWRKLHKQQGEELKKLKRSFKPKK